MLLNNLALFLRIVEKGGMASAGKEFGLSPASVSERMASLEAYYGARLLNRTTRSISVTDEGRELVDGARRILNEAEEVETRIKLGVDRLSGAIHLTTPVDLGRSHIVPLLDQFQEEHPEVAIDLILNDGYLDLVSNGLDFAVRMGNLQDSSLMSKALGTNQSLVLAAPSYLQNVGTPLHPDDLANHNCILRRLGMRVENTWRFNIHEGEEAMVIHGNRIANSGHLVKTWCKKGHGIAKLSYWDARDELESGEVVSLLDDFLPPPRPVQIVYAAGVTQPRRVRVLMDYLAKGFSNERG